ncbi:MAG: ThaI family type II restriction endonuclease [Opitutae bacterium]|nr:ThaI family type II restriction endonuclease [Opitutae bacterium]
MEQIWGIYLISQNVQHDILNKFGKDIYFKLPKIGTNPRGVEISNLAMRKLVEHPETKFLRIEWTRKNNNNPISPYEKWLKYWKME